ncbi:Telomerase activating protein Est1 [Venturia nashicola]|uniref:Telomerase activating protein Est1 n=1 Tax=Venturia nashicola TaxID=86259 RepID=A0A4Z1NPI9_9PEZI|nr:Telomerase activating protein Est1 [Venturia nashicola]TLD27609.1 Telomerase activating protein Est1 [Venturia nashicola]
MNRLQELSRKVVDTSDQKFGAQHSPTPENDHRVNIEHAMAPYRDFLQGIIIHQTMAACKEKLDGALWNMHTRIHGRFRNALQKLASQKQQKTAIHRQTVDDYLRFIKASQKSYRNFLCALDAAYPTLAKLRSIALSINAPNNPADAPISASPAPTAIYIPDELKVVVLDLGHETLLHLGDLSRWRYQSQIGKTRDVEWRAAARYYRLANEMLPSSGFGKHQEAVLALGANKYFYALSYLYHSMCAETPYPEANQNLDILLRKRLDIPWDDLIQKVWTHDGGNSVSTLRAWFLKFHVECYRGIEFSQHAQMESEIVTQLSNALKDDSDLTSTLMHMVTISIGGEFVALDKANRNIDREKNAKACLFLLHHNVKLFRELLLSLYDKLESQSRESVESSSLNFMGKLPPVTETTLYCIRLYTLWLVKTWKPLQALVESGHSDHAIIAADVRQLWRLFADCLNAIYQQYPLLDSKSVEDVAYLLDEEESTMGFRPLHDAKNADVWKMDGKPKAVSREPKSDALKEQEHLIRLRDIVTRGIIIAQEPASPFIMMNTKIEVNEAGTISDVLSPTTGPEYEGEPITPPPTAGVDRFVATAEGDQFDDRLWVDGADGPTWNMPSSLPSQTTSVPLYGYRQQPNGHGEQTNDFSLGAVQPTQSMVPSNSAGKPKPAITIEQLIQKAYYPHVKPSEVRPPTQMPWLLSFPWEDCIWRNDDRTVAGARTQWSDKPFGTSMVYPEWLHNV